MKNCSSCGASIADDDRFCANCGTAVAQSESTENEAPEASSKPIQGQSSSAGAIILGVLSLIGWIISVVGVPLAVVGLVVSGSKKNMVGGALCTIGLMLSIANAVWGGVKRVEAERESEMRRRADLLIQELDKFR